MRIAVRALRRNKLRTLLTMLGMIIGVGAVIAMVGIGRGEVANRGPDRESRTKVILIFSGSFTRDGAHSGWGGAGTLRWRIRSDSARNSRSHSCQPGGPQHGRRSQRKTDWSTQIMGERVDYFHVAAMAVQGRQLVSASRMFAAPIRSL